MHRDSIRRTLSALLLGMFGFAGAAQAVVNFESIAPNFFGDGESFSENGFTLVQSGFLGTVDTAAGFAIAIPPSGNATQFYSALNDSGIGLTTTDHSLFNLNGFDAGFIVPIFQEEGVSAGRIVVSAIGAMGQSIVGSWDLGLSGSTGSFMFLTFNALGDFAPFRNLQSVFFNACVYVGNSCVNPAENLAQFSLDNINVVAVPEPETYALLMLGVAALAYRRRQLRHQHS